MMTSKTSNDSIEADENICLSFSPKVDSYQQGHLGLEPTKVAGILKINFPSTKPLMAKKIELVFSGKEEIMWKEYQQKARGYASYTVSVAQNSEQEEFTRNAYLIWEAGEKENYGIINNLELPFSFRLDNNLPASSIIKCDDATGKIYYRVVVVIHRKSNILKLQGKKKVIKFPIPITRYARIPYKPAIIRWISDKAENIVNYDIKIDRAIFAKGESIMVPMKIKLHNPLVKIKKVSVGIKQFTEFWNAGSLVRDREEGYLGQKEEVEGYKVKLAAGSEQEYYIEMCVKIPDDDSVRYTVTQSLIVVRHRVDVEVKLEAADDIKLEREVNIVNLLKK